jgi:HK97 gp10 family phage protein
MMGIKVDVTMTGLNGILDTLQSLPKELVSRRGGPVRAALRKGAVVIFKEAQKNLQAVVNNTTDEGKKLSTGLLLKNLVVTRGKEPIGTKGERYLVRVRKKSYGRQGKPVTTLATANLLEYGSAKQPAEPWLRPAFAAKAEEAIRTVETELVKGVDRIVKKLAAQNKGK